MNETIHYVVRDHLRRVIPLRNNQCDVATTEQPPAVSGETWVAVYGGQNISAEDVSEEGLDQHVGCIIGITRRSSRAPEDRLHGEIYAKEANGVIVLAKKIIRALRRDRYILQANINTMLPSDMKMVEPLKLLSATGDVVEVGPSHFNEEANDRRDDFGLFLPIEFGEGRIMEEYLLFPVVADFGINPDIEAGDNPVQFRNLSQGQAIKWAWAFGDGDTSGDWAPSHNYADGPHSCQLTQTAPDGSTSVKVRTVTIAGTSASLS
jgi:hypothetical protein